MAINLFVDVLDDGFVVKHEGRRRAIQSYHALEDFVLALVKSDLQDINHLVVQDAAISIDIVFDPPRQA